MPSKTSEEDEAPAIRSFGKGEYECSTEIQQFPSYISRTGTGMWKTSNVIRLMIQE